MTTRTAAILGFTLILLPRPALAQAPTVTFSQGVTEVLFETPGIYDFSRHYASSDSDGVTVTIDVTHDAEGRLSGTSTTVGGSVDIRGRLTGRVRTVQGTTLLTEKLKSKGTTTGDKPDFRSLGVTSGRVAGIGGGAVLVSQLKTTACVRLKFGKKQKTVCNTAQRNQETNLAHDGDWRVVLALDANGTSIAGSGAIVVSASTSDARTFAVQVGGRFDPDTGEATLELEPLSPGGPERVTIRGIVVPNSEGDRLHAVHEVKGRILGQKFDEVF